MYMGARNCAVGWDTALQSGRSRVRFPLVSLEFFFDIIFPALGLTQTLTELSNRNISWRGERGRGVGLTTLPRHVPIVLKSGNLNYFEISGPVQACNWIALSFTYVYENSLPKMLTL